MSKKVYSDLVERLMIGNCFEADYGDTDNEFIIDKARDSYSIMTKKELLELIKIHKD